MGEIVCSHLVKEQLTYFIQQYKAECYTGYNIDLTNKLFIIGRENTGKDYIVDYLRNNVDADIHVYHMTDAIIAQKIELNSSSDKITIHYLKNYDYLIKTGLFQEDKILYYKIVNDLFEIIDKLKQNEILIVSSTRDYNYQDFMFLRESFEMILRTDELPYEECFELSKQILEDVGFDKIEFDESKTSFIDLFQLLSQVNKERSFTTPKFIKQTLHEYVRKALFMGENCRTGKSKKITIDLHVWYRICELKIKSIL